MSVFVASPEQSNRFRRYGGTLTCGLSIPWAATGIAFLGEGPAFWVALIVSALFIVAIAVYAVRFNPENPRERKIFSNWRRHCILAILGTLGLSAIAVGVLILVALPAIIPAIIAMIVGAVYLPLAVTFDERGYTNASAEMFVMGALSIVMYAVAEPKLSGTIAGLGSALVLWKTSLNVTRTP